MTLDPEHSGSSYQTPPAAALDLTACDLEPIHIPGSIQPHGRLLVVAQDGLTVIGAAGAGGFGKEAIGSPLLQALDGALSHLRLDDIGKDGPRILGPATIADTPWEVVAYHSDDNIVLEFLPGRPDNVVDARFLGYMQSLEAMLERSSSLADLFRNAARAFQDLTGHARVMIYRFNEDEAGAVVGESRDKDMPAFMNHHFPASDVPKQARVLYVRNRVRVIVDVDAQVQPITGSVHGIESADLSDSMLRSVSPIHLRYLRNMGVKASASMSIVKDGPLWGLVACHHPLPRDLSLTTRLACHSLADSLARQIRLREETHLYRERIRLRAEEDTVLSRLGPDERLSQFLGQSSPALAELVNADGFAVVQGADVLTHGSCPGLAQLKVLAEHLGRTAMGKPHATAQLSREFPPAEAYRDIASGLLAVTMPTDVPTTLMWFRAEKLQIVTWAGNPHRNVPAMAGATLEPRASFEAWSDEVRGTSRPWTTAEVESAGRLARLMLEARNSRRIRRLNNELSATLRENETLIQQKEYLLREVNHRVQNSLSLVASFLRMQGRGAEPEVRAQLEEAQSRLSAVSLVHRRLYQDNSAEIVDLSIYLGDLVRDMKSALDPAWSGWIETEFAPVLVSADKAVSIGLLTNELVANAIKYAYGGQPGPVSVSLKQVRDAMRLEVADNGVGSDGTVKGTGFGMRMMSGMVEQLEGQLLSEDNLPGLRIIVTAPVE